MEQWIGGGEEQVIGDATVRRGKAETPNGSQPAHPPAKDRAVQGTGSAENSWVAERRRLGNRGTLERVVWWERKGAKDS